MHLDEEQVERLVHGELVPRVETQAREHLAACAECRARFETAEREERDVARLLHLVDHPVPPVQPESLALRARRPAWSRYRWAAGLFLALGAAGVAYAVPGSPVPDWVRAVVEGVSGSGEAAAPPPEQPPPPAGIAVAPGPRLVIEFTTSNPDGRIRVSLTPDADVVVRAPAGTATYTSAPGRLVVENASGPVAFDVAIPRSAPWVEIRIAGARVFLKDGPQVTTDATADTAGPYFLPLVGGGR